MTILKRTLLLTVALVTVCASSAVAGTAPRLNPFAPMNAVAAYPLTPYNLEQYPGRSQLMYPPCPTCPPAASLLPDPPFTRRMRNERPAILVPAP